MSIDKFNFAFDKLADLLLAFFVTVLGYLSPIKEMAHVVVFFFFLDVIYGWQADKKLNKAKFNPAIVWKKTVPRLVLSIILLVSSFILDQATGQEVIHTHALLGWFICSLLFISIIKNGYIVTNWEAIPLIGNMIKTQIKEKTDIDLNKEKNDNT